MTNKNEIEGRWDQMIGKIKQKYADLTDDDLKFAEGKAEELWGRLKEKLGKTQEQIRKEIGEL